MFASLAIALYLLGLVLRNQQLVTVAVVLLSFLTWAAFMSNHAMFLHLVEELKKRGKMKAYS